MREGDLEIERGREKEKKRERERGGGERERERDVYETEKRMIFLIDNHEVNFFVLLKRNERCNFLSHFLPSPAM